MSDRMPTQTSLSRRQFLAAGVCSPLALMLGNSLGLPGSTALAQEVTDSQYIPVSPVRLALDRPGVWTLNFAYTPIRIIEVDVPGQGRKLVWYMVYKVYNRTGLPRLFIPQFELVTKDIPGSFLDEPQPSVVKAIRKIEDPTGALNIHTSVSISESKIPVTKPDSIPRSVYGVAVWLDVAKKNPKTNAFSVYVLGLSNGVARMETEGGTDVVSRKTLQIDFTRPTDDRRNLSTDIRPNDNSGLGAERWVYRPVAIRKADGEENGN